jgi:hypothetical protein
MNAQRATPAASRRFAAKAIEPEKIEAEISELERAGGAG